MLMVDDTDRLRQRLLSGLLGSPLVLGPAAVGVSTMLGGWAVGARPAVSLFAGVAGLAVGLGVAATRWVLGAETLVSEAARSLREDAAQRKRGELIALDHRLKADGDRRSNEALARLRVLHQRLEPYLAWAEVGGAASGSGGHEGDRELGRERVVDLPPDLLSTLRRLHDSSLASLERSLELHEASQRSVTRRRRDELLAQRRALLDEVDQSVRHLAVALDEVQALSMKRREPEAGLAELRRELDQSLEVAKRVEQRIADLDHHLRPPTRQIRE